MDFPILTWSCVGWTDLDSAVRMDLANAAGVGVVEAIVDRLKESNRLIVVQEMSTSDENCSARVNE